MARKPIMAGNWKMNETLQEGVALAKEINDSLKAEKNMRQAMPEAVRWLQSEGYHFLRIGDAP